MSSDLTPQGKILLVDDDEDDLFLTREFLCGIGYKVTSAQEGISALHLIDHHSFDTVLLDQRMPGMSGQEVLCEIRRKQTSLDLPVIMVTGLDEPEKVVEALQNGANDYVTKPIEYPVLAARIKTQVTLKIQRDNLQRTYAQIENDLSMAREIQHTFLPLETKQFPPDPAGRGNCLRFDFHYQPAATLGGDFFDIFPISANKCALVLCDVMGHGVQPSLVGAFLLGTLQKMKAIAEEPKTVMTQVHREIAKVFHTPRIPMFASAFYAVLDVSTGEVSYTNAGHPDPLLLRTANDGVRLHELCHTSPLPALGIDEHAIYIQESIVLQDCDRILLYTDGAYENLGIEDVSLGFNKFKEEALAEASSKPLNFLEGFRRRLYPESIEGSEDDVCIIVASFSSR